jgi:amidohydrolase
MNNQIHTKILSIKEELVLIVKALYSNPELGNQEFKAAKLLTESLESHGFTVEKKIINIPTAFRAEYDSGKPGPKIAYLCEYDALPGIGHGCGHNLIAAMSLGAGIGLKEVMDQIGGSVVVLGTPAEETDGAKVYMSRNQVFDNIDIAMILHPASRSYKSGKSLAMVAMRYEFIGQSSHAAAAPAEGVNALDSVIQFFNGINAFRHYMPEHARIHGIIKEGGVAANIIPDRAVADFYLRAPEKETVQALQSKLQTIAQCSAQMVGCTLQISEYELGYENMKTNEKLSNIFTNQLLSLGVDDVSLKDEYGGSIDMGNVSQVVPAIHPYIGMSQEELIIHSSEFADATLSEFALTRMVIGATALAQTGYHVIADKSALQEIQDEFNR